MTRQVLTAVEADFHERMHAAQMHGLWELASQMTRHPEPPAIPHMWKAALIEKMVRESGEVVPVGEERRALQFFNPGPSWALHEHANLARHDAAVLFSIQDRPVLEALRLYREEAFTENGGHQAVTSTFQA